jgi:hypothetical protein
MRNVLLLRTLALILTAALGGQYAPVTVYGTVTMRNGEKLAGATITAVDEATGQTFSVTADAEGKYRLDLPPGRYTITAKYAGFASVQRRGVDLAKSREVNITVSRGGNQTPTGAVKPTPPPATARPAPPPPPASPPVATPGPDGPVTGAAGTPKEASGTVSWNTWPAAYPGPRYQPISHFQPNKDYQVVLHLAAVAYGDAGVSAKATSGDVSGWVEDWLKAGEPTAALQVLLLPDTNYFNVVDGRVKRLDVDLKALRDWTNTPGAAAPASPLAKVRELSELGRDLPNFVFGEVALRLHTTNREGVGAVALSIWSDAGRPLDEITLNYCVSTSDQAEPPVCSGIQPVQQTLKGTDSVRIATQADAAPDAALHFLELDNRGVIGVFHENRCQVCPYHVWTLGRTGDDLRNYVANTLLPAFGPTASLASLTDAGQGLYNLIFPSDDTDGDRSVARAAFERFIQPDLTSEPRMPPRSIFVRTLLSGTAVARPLYLPIGLITTPVAPGEFLGFRFRIEAPLEHQSYRAGTTCISRWFLAVPPSNPSSPDVLPTARRQFEPLMTSWSPRAQKLFSTIPELRSWLLEPKPVEPSAAVVLLSHHDQSTVYFDTNEKLASTEVVRRFGESTLLVLDGCSTGAPMAVDLLRQFNERGVAATIASQVAVTPQLAGDFMAALGEQIEIGDPRQGATIADIFYRTLQELRQKQASDTALPYGARALVFSLLGNGAIRICSPQKATP